MSCSTVRSCSRTAEGTKLISTAINHNVLFQADDHNVAEGWSVIVKGMARSMRSDEEIAEAEQAQLLPWIATVKPHDVRIRPISVTGRRFMFGSEPDLRVHRRLSRAALALADAEQHAPRQEGHRRDLPAQPTTPRRDA